jgi:hypothetical protein
MSRNGITHGPWTDAAIAMRNEGDARHERRTLAFQYARARALIARNPHGCMAALLRLDLLTLKRLRRERTTP